MEIRKKLNERLIKEKERLEVHEGKVKRCKDNITKLEEMLRLERFNEAEHVINATGFTLEEIMAAVQGGDFSNLQRKIKNLPPASGSAAATN
jgi:fructose-1,6-bisphosphatase/sedoheptulose 1,7-bisphosphatase-like protein